MTKEQVLKQYFGYDTFRPLQADIINTILKQQDCLVLMPTGGGKSLCFQVPAMVMEGMAIVISPLIALMKDQVEALKGNGITAAYLNSTLSSREQYELERQCEAGQIKLLYISPEKLFTPSYLDFIKRLHINLFAIDEAHCVSFWGHDFRPEYTQLNVLKNEFPEVPVVALTATADRVTRKDILIQLGVPDATVFTASFDRPNLSLSVLPGRKRLQVIQSFLLRHQNQAGIIYCLARKTTESVAESLKKMGFKVNHYHAGCDAAHRSAVQEQFLQDDLQIIVATIAFGMGIDKSNVRWVIHYNLPKNVENFYQEIGRAGRDGMPSDTLLFYSYGDLITQTDFINNSEAPEVQKELLRAKLDRMKQYAEADICRRRILLSYFNETVEKDCGNCDVCKNPRQKFDGTVLAQKALSAIARTNEKVAMGTLIDILRGSHNRTILQHGYEQLKTFGAGKDLKGEVWADYLSQLLNSGAMDIAYDEGHSFKLNETSWKILKGQQAVSLVEFVPYEIKKAQQEAEVPPEKTKKEILKDELFERLRTLRKQIADRERVPPYVVFSDQTLSEMSIHKPVNKVSMLAISGVGQQKFEKYGEVFINEILSFAKENTVKGETRVIKGITYVVTHDLYNDGYTIEEIAKQREMTTGTILGHLLKLREQGHSINVQKFISNPERQAIQQAAAGLNLEEMGTLTEIFNRLNGQIDYYKIRIVVNGL
ncbi:MAG: DNA helicase RecQ [Spirosomataceae bacterium]